MKKYFFILIFILLSQKAIAIEGVVIVLDAPLFEKPKSDSHILDFVRKGQKVMLHKKDFGLGPNDVDYYSLSPLEDQDVIGSLDQLKDTGFYKTLTADAKDAYISKKHVKVIYLDQREFAKRVSNLPDDPTEYRISEPLPENYPLYTVHKYRSNISLGIGPGHKFHYPYVDNVNKESFTARSVLQFQFLKNVLFDKSNRLYFGGVFHFTTEEHKFTFDNSRESKETLIKTTIGPALQYDFFKTKKYVFNVGGSLMVDFIRNFVSIENSSGSNEERSFNGFNLSPKVSTSFYLKKVLPEIDFFTTLEVNTLLPGKYSSSTKQQIPEYWNKSNDYVSHSFTANFNILVGIQYAQ
jgi:hypothetical protein